MAKTNKSEKYSKAIISVEEDTITEISNDGEATYSLSEFLRRWDGVENVSVSISCADEIEPI